MRNIAPESSTPTKFNMTLRCGDCLHYNGSAHPNFDKPCAIMGIGSNSEAPSCYTPDVTAFRSFPNNAFSHLATIVASLSPRQSRIFMGLLKYAGSLDRAGYSFLQEVYFSIGNRRDAYLDDYYKGYTLALVRGGQIALVGHDFLNAARGSTLAYLDKSSLLTQEQFDKHKKRLIEAGMIRKPQVVRFVKAGTYEIPTMDHAPKGEKIKPKKVMSKADLTVSD